MGAVLCIITRSDLTAAPAHCSR